MCWCTIVHEPHKFSHCYLNSLKQLRHYLLLKEVEVRLCVKSTRQEERANRVVRIFPVFNPSTFLRGKENVISSKRRNQFLLYLSSAHQDIRTSEFQIPSILSSNITAWNRSSPRWNKMNTNSGSICRDICTLAQIFQKSYCLK